MKRKRLTNREWWARYGPRFERTDRLLRARIEHHRRKLIEERPGWTPPETAEEWVAHAERRLQAERGE